MSWLLAPVAGIECPLSTTRSCPYFCDRVPSVGDGARVPHGTDTGGLLKSAGELSLQSLTGQMCVFMNSEGLAHFLSPAAVGGPFLLPQLLTEQAFSDSLSLNTLSFSLVSCFCGFFAPQFSPCLVLPGARYLGPTQGCLPGSHPLPDSISRSGRLHYYAGPGRGLAVPSPPEACATTGLAHYSSVSLGMRWGRTSPSCLDRDGGR